MTILEFLGDLAKDPTRQLQFRQNPVETARKSGLPESVVAELASRDSARLREVLAESTGTTMIYSPDTAMIYSPETALIYSPETA